MHCLSIVNNHLRMFSIIINSSYSKHLFINLTKQFVNRYFIYKHINISLIISHKNSLLINVHKHITINIKTPSTIMENTR